MWRNWCSYHRCGTHQQSCLRLKWEYYVLSIANKEYTIIQQMPLYYITEQILRDLPLFSVNVLNHDEHQM